MIAPNEPLKDAIYYSQPREWYDSIGRLSATTLLEMECSAQHCKAAVDGKLKKTSEALAFGTAFHHYILEHGTFDIFYQRTGRCSAVLKSGPNKGDQCKHAGTAMDGEFWLCGQHSKDRVGLSVPDNVVTDQQFQSLERMAEALKNNDVMKLLKRRGGCEATVLWNCLGVPFKSRLDKLILGDVPAILDLKKVSSRGGEKNRFSKAIDRYGYAVRAALYVDAVKQLTGQELPYIWIVCEDCEPFCVGSYQCGDDSLDCGRFLYRTYISEYKRGLESDKWRGWTEKIEENGLPDYVRKKLAGGVASMLGS